MSDNSAQSYWKSNIRIVLSLLAVWFFISFGCGILLVDVLDNFRIGGFKLVFCIAQQGSNFVFVLLKSYISQSACSFRNSPIIQIVKETSWF